MVTSVIKIPADPSACTSSRVRFTVPFWAVLGAALAGVILCMLPKSIVDPDIGWHLRNAAWLVRNHSFLHKDVYSFTVAGKPWIDPEWLAELAFYAGWRTWGDQGVFLVEWLSILGVMFGIFGLGWQRTRDLRSAFAVTYAALFLASVSFGPRTLLFGWLCLVAELAILEHFRSCGADAARVLWLLPPLFALWINLHGSWLIGLVLLAVFCGSGFVAGRWGCIEAVRWRPEQRRTLGVVFLLSVGALFANPYGWRLVVYPFDLAFRQKLNVASVQEWQSLDFHTPRGKIVFLLLALGIVNQFVRGRRWALHEAAWLLIGLYAGLTYSRFLFLAAILLLPMLADQIPAAEDGWRRERPLLDGMILVALLLSMAVAYPSRDRLQSAWKQQDPVAAVGYLREHPPAGHLFTAYEWGGYLILHDPALPVFIDSRVDVFEHHGVLRDYLDAVHLRNTFAVFRKYDISAVLFPANAPLTYLLLHTPGWAVGYRDKTAVLLVRESAAAGSTDAVQAAGGQ
jgi:hypothetical protein